MNGEPVQMTNAAEMMPSPASPTLANPVLSPAGQTAAFGLAAGSPSVFYADDFVTLYNADCRAVLPSLDLSNAFCFTDPPYNVGKAYGTWNDAMPDDEYLGFVREWIDVVKTCKHGVCLYTPAKWLPQYWLMLGRARQIVMTRNAAGAIRNGFANYFASMLTTAKPKNAPKDWWHNMPCPGQGYFFREETYDHPGYTSEAVTNRVLAEICPPEAVVVDPFAGTGTTLWCAKLRGMRAIGCEIDRGHCETIAKRCSQHVLSLENDRA